MRAMRSVLVSAVPAVLAVSSVGVTAAQEPAPSSRTNTDILPGVTLTVEEVEPGVFRVLSDDVRDISIDDDGYRLQLAGIGKDGSVWMRYSHKKGYRLGRAKDRRLAKVRVLDDVAPTWGHHVQVEEGNAASGADGTTWVLPFVDYPQWDAGGVMYEVLPSEGVIVRRDGDGEQEWGADEGVPVVSDGYRMPGGMFVASDGGLWLSYPLVSPQASQDRWAESIYDGVTRFDGTSWQRYLRGHMVESMAFAHDGSVWLTAGRQGDGEYYPSLSHLYVIRPPSTMLQPIGE